MLKLKQLYDLVNQYAISLYHKISRFLKKNDNERVMLFRIVVLFIWINLFGTFVLAKINPFHLLSPFKFLSLPPVDTRKEIILYFPASIKDLNEKSGSSEKSNIVELHQKTRIDDNYTSANREKLIVDNARGILQQLALAPDSIRGVKAIKNELMIRQIWLYKGDLYVHLDLKILNDLGENQKNLTVNCIRKSLQANLGAFADISLIIK